MKIGFFTNSSKMGGAEHSLADVFRVCMYDKTLISLGDGELIDRVGPDNCKVFKPSDGKPKLMFFNKVFFLRKEFSSVDLVYANGNKAFVLAALIKLFLQGKYKIIWHVRDSFNASHFGPIRYVMGLLTHLVRARVIYNSDYSRRSLISSFGRNGTVIYNGFDPKLFEGKPDNNSPAEMVRMISTSRISPWKGQLELVNALGKVKRNFQLTICGDSLFGENEYFDKVKQRVIELGLSNHVEFLGHVSDVPALLKSGNYDLVLHSSILPEPFGRCIVESVLAGLPIVASKHGGVKEIVGDSPAVFLFDPNECNGLVNAIELAVARVRFVTNDLNELKDKISDMCSMSELEMKINKEIESAGCK